MFKLNIKSLLSAIFTQKSQNRKAFEVEFEQGVEKVKIDGKTAFKWSPDDAEGSVTLSLSRKCKGFSLSDDEILLTNIEAEPRRQGLGTRAMKEFFLPLLMKHEISIVSHAKSTKGVQFFESLGFKFYSGTDEPYAALCPGDPIDRDMLMKKGIKPAPSGL